MGIFVILEKEYKMEYSADAAAAVTDALKVLFVTRKTGNCQHILTWSGWAGFVLHKKAEDGFTSWSRVLWCFEEPFSWVRGSQSQPAWDMHKMYLAPPVFVLL